MCFGGAVDYVKNSNTSNLSKLVVDCYVERYMSHLHAHRGYGHWSQGLLLAVGRTDQVAFYNSKTHRRYYLKSEKMKYFLKVRKYSC